MSHPRPGDRSSRLAAAIIIIGGLVGPLAGCASPTRGTDAPRARLAPPAEVVLLDGSFEALRQRFDATADRPRLLTLLSPT